MRLMGKLSAFTIFSSVCLVMAVLASCRNPVVQSDSGDPYPEGIVSVGNGEVVLEISAGNDTVRRLTRSVLPSIGSDIYFTIIASTRKYGGDGEELDPEKSSSSLYAAHTTYAGHANYASDSGVFIDASTLDADSDGYFDDSDLARPFFSTEKGVPPSQRFTLRTNTQWYFTAYGTNRSPYAIALQHRIGSGDYKMKRDGGTKSTVEDFEEYQNHWGREEWTKLVLAIQEESVIAGDLPLYIRDNGNSGTTGLYVEQIELLSAAEGTAYTSGLFIAADTDSGSTGHFLLPICVPKTKYDTDPVVVKSVVASWAVQGNVPQGSTASDGSVAWVRDDSALDSAQTFAFYPELGEGNYSLTVNFYNSADASGEPVYEIADDSLVVWGGRDSVVTASSESAYAQFTSSLTSESLVRISGRSDDSLPESYAVKGYSLTREEIINFRRTRFYVSNGMGQALKKHTGNPTGSIFSPFESVTDAVRTIEASPRLRSNLWYIVIDGTPADDGYVAITNPALESDETGDYTLVIQSLKPSDRASIAGGMRLYNQNGSEDSALKVILRNIDVTGEVQVGTQNLMLDNATVNATGSARTWLRAKTNGAAWEEAGLINVPLTDATSTVGNIFVYDGEANPEGFSVLRGCSIDYDAASFECALVNTVNSGSSDIATFIPTTEAWLNRFKATTMAAVYYTLVRNEDTASEYEGCLMLKRAD